MPFKAPAPKTGSGDFTPAPAGNHLAICIGVVDLGTQDDTWQGEPKQNRKVLFKWELADELMDDGRPFTVARTFNVSMHEKSSLRKFLNPWVGPITEAMAAEYDLEQLLGKPCMLTVVRNQDRENPEKFWANVEAAAPLPKRTQAPKPVNDLVLYTLDMGAPPESFGERLRERILGCREFRGKGVIPPASSKPQAPSQPASAEEDDDIPFDETEAGGGCPFTRGDQLVAWADQTGEEYEVHMFSYLRKWGKAQGHPAKIGDWSPDQVLRGYVEGCRQVRHLNTGGDAETFPLA